jgi:hypothetical protein
MKYIGIMIAFLIFSASAFPQTEDVFSNKVNTALEKVLKDYPNRFHNIKGEILVQGPQTTEYRSTVQVPGSASCVVVRNNQNKIDAYAWTCTALKTVDFYQAKNKFKEIFDQVDNTIIKIDGQKPFILSGQYASPAEDNKSTAINFDLLPAVGEIKKIKVALVLLKEPREWKISLQVCDNDLKDEGQGSLTNN